MKFMWVAMMFGLFATTALAQITYEGGDGTSMANAVVIAGAMGESDGVDSEYVWLDQNFPGYASDGQALLQDSAKVYDLLTIHHQGKKYEVYFDITGYFGK
ncbi:MAG: hypothetical protein ABIV25_13515 [Paracoccaceae bacterium]